MNLGIQTIIKLTVAVPIYILISCKSQPDCQKHIIQFGGDKWNFPSTIGEAVKKHDLSFNSPAAYHKEWGNTRRLILDFKSESGDFDNDLQQKEDLFARNVNEYTFQIRQTGDTYDSLRDVIESIYQRKFVLVKGTKTDIISNSEKKRPFEHDLLKVDSCFTIGIKNSYSDELGDVVTVYFLYGLTLGDIGIEVGNY